MMVQKMERGLPRVTDAGGTLLFHGVVFCIEK